MGQVLEPLRGARRRVRKHMSGGHELRPNVVKTRNGYVSDFGKSCLQGSRPYNEDRVYASAVWSSETSLFCVFDGHGGAGASVFCASQVPVQLDRETNETTQVKEAFEAAFIDVETKFFAEHPEDESGTTAVTLLVDASGKYWCANVGDSRAILYRSGMGFPLSADHCFANDKERRRVVKLGGAFDEVGRFRGEIAGLACFRSIGDRLFDQNIIVSKPEVLSGAFTSSDEFVVMGSDGLYETLDDEDIYEDIVDRLAKDESAQTIAEAIANRAISLGSKDNVSMILIVLKKDSESIRRSRSNV